MKTQVGLSFSSLGETSQDGGVIMPACGCNKEAVFYLFVWGDEATKACFFGCVGGQKPIILVVLFEFSLR